ncbi:metal ABC transporter substrate-binding protein [Hahella sp. SMD15-11]|uniref:High-affinity zinc uptake system protein ZnuA n=1 Tax=Thermohahella caldifontis TaxID=3142973 RepID=A0AB39UX37_9GAMM
MSVHTLIIRTIFLFLMTWSVPGLSKPVKIGVTIHPYRLMVEALAPPADTAVTTTMLIPEQADPHSFMLRPSDLRTLLSVDRIIWSGPHLEPHLARALERMPQEKVLVLTPEDGPTHFWLSPSQTLRQLEILADQLGLPVLPGIKTELEKKEAELAATLLQLKRTHIEVWAFHPFLDALEKDFGFNYHTLTSGDHGLSSDKLRNLESTSANRCLVVEPEWSGLSRKPSLARHFQVIMPVDPLFRQASSLKEIYIQLIDTFRACMKKGG